MSPSHKRNERAAELLRLEKRINELEQELARTLLRNDVLKTLLQALPDIGVIFDGDGRFVEVLTGEKSMLFGPGRLLVGKRVQQVFPGEVAKLMMNTIQTVLDTGDQQTVEFGLDHPTGMQWFEAKVALVGDIRGAGGKVAWASRNVTERKKTEEALQESEERFRAIAEHSPIPIIVSKIQKGEVLYSNSAANQFFLGEGGNLVGHLGINLWEKLEEREKMVEALEQQNMLESVENSLRAHDGSYRWMLGRWQKIRFEGHDAILSTLVDITQRKEAEERIKENEYQLQLIANAVPVMLSHFDREERWQFAVKRSGEWMGREPAQLIGKHISEVHSPEAYARLKPHIQKVLAGEQVEYEEEVVFPDGVERVFRAVYIPDQSPEGRVQGFISMVEDITARKRSDEALQASRRLIQTVFDTVPNWLTVKGLDGRYIMVNRAFSDYWNSTPEEMIGGRFNDFINSPDNGRIVQESDRQVLEHNEQVQLPGHVTIGPDGNSHVGDVIKFPLRDEAGLPIGIVATTVDVTDRVRAEEELRNNQRLLQAIFDTIPHSLFVRDRDSTYLMINRGLADRYGVEPENIQGRNLLEPDLPIGTLADRKWLYEQDRKVFETGERVENERFVWNYPRDGQRILSNILLPLKDDRGEVAGLVGVAEDITERLTAERELQESEARFRNTFDYSPSAINLKDLRGRYLMVNPAFANLYGFAETEIIGKMAHDIFPGELADVVKAQEQQVIVNRAPQELERDVVTRSGQMRRVVSTKYPVMGSGGEIIGVGTIITDVTEHRKMEEQLRDTQKLEAIGKLAGGVAHEFNNMLQVIKGYTAILAASSNLPAKSLGELALMDRTVDRAAGLTQRLLMFSRRSNLRPQVLDLNGLIKEHVVMLDSIIEEIIEIEFASEIEQLLVKGDPGMLAQVLLNLCNNARDAMPQGGRLYIRSSMFAAEGQWLDQHPWASAGLYACVKVQDSGTGIAPEVVPRIFEPFFTTKEVGKGSGLGLAMSYGIMQQHQGMIEVKSQPGRGSTFAFYVPMADGRLEDRMPSQKIYSGGKETILLGEDEQDLLEMLAHLLHSAGYTVLKAENGEDAVRLLKTFQDEIDIALLDVVMPKMGGWEVYQQIEAVKPGLPVVFSTGYEQDVIEEEKLAKTSARLLRKPYHPDVLFRLIRELLNGG